MLHLPARFAAIIVAFAPLFRHRTWHDAEILLVGAILAPGKRTVTSILRITGLSREPHFGHVRGAAPADGLIWSGQHRLNNHMA